MEQQIKELLARVVHPETQQSIVESGVLESVTAREDKIVVVLCFQKARDPFAVRIKNLTEKILADAKNVKTMQEALALSGVKADTLRRVTFSSPAYISKVPSSEPAISGAAAALEEGAFSAPIKGNGGVYFLQVIKKKNGVAKFDAAAEQSTLENVATRNINSNTIMNELYRKGDIKDNRYRFF